MEEHHISTYLFWKIEFCEAISLLCCWEGGWDWRLSLGSMSATNASGDICSAGKQTKFQNQNNLFPVGNQHIFHGNFTDFHRIWSVFTSRNTYLMQIITKFTLYQWNQKQKYYFLISHNKYILIFYVFYRYTVRTSSRYILFNSTYSVVGWFSVRDWMVGIRRIRLLWWVSGFENFERVCLSHIFFL